MLKRPGLQALSIAARELTGSSRPSLSTARLMTCHRTSTGRTFSTSIIQREVIQAHGQIGSNQKSAMSRSDTTQHPFEQWEMMRQPSHRSSDGASRGCAPPAPRGPPMAGSGAIHHHDDGGPVPGTNLTRDEAAERARLLDVGSYDVELDL